MSAQRAVVPAVAAVAGTSIILYSPRQLYAEEPLDPSVRNSFRKIEKQATHKKN